MKKVRILMFSLHRVLGTIISLLFLMWFVSGLVLLYHNFPNVTKQQIYENMSLLPDSLPSLDNISKRINISDTDIQSVSISEQKRQTIYTIQTKDSTYLLCADSAKEITPINDQLILATAQHWVNTPILKIDTLLERDIWIMYTRYEKELPIYKFYFDDTEKHQLYISSQTAEVQQFTTETERFWAWVGSIPHKFYIPILRKHTDAWTTALTVSGFIAMIVAMSGMYLGIMVTYRRYRKNKKLTSPYKKPWYSWHHVAGLFFGLFMITFAFSGAMALQKIPQWIIKTHGDYRISDKKLKGKQPKIKNYKLDYRLLKSKYSNIKAIEWTYFRDIPIYNIIDGNKEISIDASSDSIKELYIPTSEVEKAIKSVHGENIKYNISLIYEYDEYYLSRNKNLPLPVYKVMIDNEDHSRYYINPTNGNFSYLNKSRIAKKWVFSGLHYLNIKYLVERPILWTVLIWLLCIGGTIVSGTGVYLSVRYIVRKITSKINKHKRK